MMMSILVNFSDSIFIDIRIKKLPAHACDLKLAKNEENEFVVGQNLRDCF